MKTRLIFLYLLIVCFSCRTNNNPLTDVQKDKIKGEVKEVVNAFVKGCEEANADMVMESFLDSPDFVDLTNGMTFNYKEMMAMKPNFDAILNQKCTMVNEKYTFLDKSTVLYTAETKWSTNYKDGHSSITDPQAFLFTFKKIDNKWRIIYLVDSNVEKNIPSESSKELNQVELMEKQVGYWECDNLKDTVQFYETKAFGKGYDNYYKRVKNGRIVFESKELWSYDRNYDKYLWIVLPKSTDSEIRLIWYTSENKYEVIRLKDAPSPEKADWKIQGEFKSPKVIVETTLINNKPTKTETWTRVK